jgi:CRP-like cAMP-binding protein
MTEGDCKDSTNSCEKCGHRLTSIICSTDPEVWKKIESFKSKSVYRPKQTIFYQDNDPIGLFTVLSGLVKLESHSDAGQAHTLRYLGPGSPLGYRALFSNEKYNASAVVVDTAEICFVPKKPVMDLFKEYPNLALKILEVLSKDLRISEDKWASQIEKDAPARVAEALIFLHANFKHQNWTRKEIAEWAGTTPETVIRTLSQFEKESLIDQSVGRGIKIVNKLKIIEKIKNSF